MGEPSDDEVLDKLAKHLLDDTHQYIEELKMDATLFSHPDIRNDIISIFQAALGDNIQNEVVRSLIDSIYIYCINLYDDVPEPAKQPIYNASLPSAPPPEPEDNGHPIVYTERVQ